MEPYQSIKGDILSRAMDEDLDLEQLKKLFKNVTKAISEAVEGKIEKDEAIERLVFETIWGNGKFMARSGSSNEAMRNSVQTAASSIRETANSIRAAANSLRSSAVSDKAMQASMRMSTNAEDEKKPLALQESASFNRPMRNYPRTSTNSNGMIGTALPELPLDYPRMQSFVGTFADASEKKPTSLTQASNKAYLMPNGTMQSSARACADIEMRNLLPLVNGKAPYTLCFKIRNQEHKEAICLSIQGESGESLSRTGELLWTHLEISFSFSGEIVMILEPQNLESFKESPSKGHNILRDAQAFLGYWLWRIEPLKPIPAMHETCIDWLTLGNLSVANYHVSLALWKGSVRFNMNTHHIVWGYHRAASHESSKRKVEGLEMGDDGSGGYRQLGNEGNKRQKKMKF
ncbi:hypothetical protein NHQ30_009924 [Ciborinia camelliae]|nr:hypothetical protein NHQ30_009924 [Ciborinia camelliae]